MTYEYRYNGKRLIKQLINKELVKMSKKKAPKLYRQGDVLLIEAAEVPEEARILEHTTVALGEATGHHHTFENKGVVLQELDEKMWVVAGEESSLVHQEHETILVEPGIYEVRIQREYEPQSADQVRRVLD